MKIELLGPLKVLGESGEIVLGAAKERALVAALALKPGTMVNGEALIDALWGETPPATARKTLQTYVSNVRRALGSDAVVTGAVGYALNVDPADVDVVRFRELVRAGESALRAGSASEAGEALRAAVALWRGDPFTGIGAHTGLASEAVRLREEYLTALEARIDADLAAGLHRELVGELEALVREHPYRERLWGHLMIALYRSDRQADALAAFQRARALFRDELGLEPGGALQRLERAVLVHDPALDLDRDVPMATGPAFELRRSPVRYALCADGVHVAYQIVGDGPTDILAIPGFVSHLDMWWDAPTDELVRRLASLGRLIIFDKRGMGLSDRPEAIDVEGWVDDAVAVLDAVGSERAAIVGISAGAPTAALFAATHPERTRVLVLYGGYARFVRGDGYDIGSDPEVVETFVARAEANWGTGFGLSVLAPSLANDPVARAYWARLQTVSASPAAAANFLRALAAADVRDALPAITAPTLILHADRDANVPIEAARFLRDAMPGATLVELASDIHLIWLSDVIEEITDAIEQFLGRTAAFTGPRLTLTTVLTIASPNLAPHGMRVVESIVERFRGSDVEGPLVSTFDGPGQAIRCATAIVAALGGSGAKVGCGVHTGECEIPSGHVRGVAVDMSRRLAALAAPGDVLVSQTVRDLVVGSSVLLEPRGRRSFDGIPGEWDVFAVASSGS